MAESLAIVGIASNIISFIEFGLKLVSGTRMIRDSLQESTPEIHELDLIVEDIQRLNNEIFQRKASSQTLSNDEHLILQMATEADALATEIRTMTKKLKLRPNARSKTFESGWIVLQGLWKNNDIERLRSRLESLDQRIRRRIQLSLTKESQSAVMLKLNRIEQSHREMQIEYESKLDLIRNDIVNLASRNQESDDMRMEQLSSLKVQLDALQKEHSVCDRQSLVLRSLHFPEIRRRWSQILPAVTAANDWLFDSTLTSFVDWLESEQSIFWICGKAGSGKSTIMKFASEHTKTRSALEKWAGHAELHTVSYYFWNQGFELQKSQLGLFQSLLYEIIRLAPNLIPHICPDRLDDEGWSIRSLKDAFERMASQPAIDTKFCFFIDGLDEFAGKEEEVVEMLKFLSRNPNIKICASSRPRLIFEEFFSDKNHILILHDFTEEDMKEYVRQELYKNEKFQSLKSSDPVCEEIVTSISDQAQGVWLWVFLVTRDLVHAVNRNESARTLKRIVQQFPPDLESYFERIIQGIKPEYREEMAQIFLITIDEVHPLPLFVFSLLDLERADTSYALKARINPIPETDSDLLLTYPTWKSRVQNRCGDLLVVDSEPHPIFLSHSVDFLHRTVRDFLQDTYYQQLHERLSSEFSSMVSLCRIMLYLLKSLTINDFRDQSCINKIIGLTDELLYYAREVEKSSVSHESPINSILDEVDKVNSHHARHLKNHWTHARDSPTDQGFDRYHEGGNCNFIALMVQARLVKYVRAKLKANPSAMHKRGRPLLDYALRPRRSTPIAMPYHSQREEASVDVEMIQVLLEHGADPNQAVHLYEGRTVWNLFLLSCYESSNKRESSSLSLRAAWYQASEMLIRHGASSECSFVQDSTDLALSGVLLRVFGPEKAEKLQSLMSEKATEAEQQAGGYCVVM